VRGVSDSGDRDASGPYPIFACSDWAALADDIEELRPELVSVSLVTDPFGDYDAAVLERAFPDRAVPFKEHVVADLGRPWEETAHKHHRRNAARALEAVEVAVVGDPPALLDEWVSLYDGLVRRHDVRGVAAFSQQSFDAQLRVGGMVALRAVEDGVTVGATLWYVSGDVAYYHLGAYTQRGYALGASFALFARALERFAADGLAWASLGAGAGAQARDDDGLTRFKRGWGTGTRTAYFCGAILQPERYEHLAAAEGAGESRYFPAYRTSEAT
jgi:hypothetical protein